MSPSKPLKCFLIPYAAGHSEVHRAQLLSPAQKHHKLIKTAIYMYTSNMKDSNSCSMEFQKHLKKIKPRIQDMSGVSYVFLCMMKNKGMRIVPYWPYNRKCTNTWGNGPQVFPSELGMTITVREWYFSAQWILYSLKLSFNLHMKVGYHKALKDYRSLGISIFNRCLWFKRGVGG